MREQQMKIVVDCRYLRVGRHDGISRYTAGIVTALARLHPIEVLVSDERQLEHLPAGLPWHHVSAPTSWREPFVARQVRRTGADVVFSPMQTMGTWGRDYRVVLTLHDLIYYRHPTPPRNLPAPVRLLWRAFHLAWWPQRLLLNRADEVVTVSETTRDLIARHRLTRRPVTVVPNAPDPAPDLPRGERTRSLVYMGSFMPYKNVELPARAMAQLPGWELHLMSPVTPEQRARLEALAGRGPSSSTTAPRTRSTATCCAVPRRSCPAPATRASGCPSWRRWRSAHPWWSATSRCSGRSAGPRARTSTRTTSTGSRVPSARSTTRPRGPSGRPPHACAPRDTTGTSRPRLCSLFW
nr:hypothetical protein GCM10025730_41310 [Promicromonospora thailandica]